MSNETLLVTKQIAAKLGCSNKTIYRRYETGKLPGAFQAGGRGSQIKMSVADLEKLKGKK